MKKISFIIIVILNPILMIVFSYIFLIYLKIKPLGIALTIAIKDTILFNIMSIILYLTYEKQIIVAIDRFQNNQNN